LIRKAHDAGWRQRDFHLGNMLIRPESTRRQFSHRFPTSDFTRPADKTRWRDLAVLHGGSTAAPFGSTAFPQGVSVGCAANFRDLRTLATRLERRGFAITTNSGGGAKRCLADNREFVRIRQSGFRGARGAD
jgi:hypothetical protein